MRNCLHSPLILLAGVVLLVPAVVRADEIVEFVDEHGHRIFVNTGGSSSPVGWITRSFSVGPPTGKSSGDYNRLVEEAAHRFQVDPDLVHAIIQVESGYNPKAVSRKGAMGLMQLIPATAQRFGVVDPFDPKQNLAGGVNYLKYLLGLFGGDVKLSLAAFNAGEHSVQHSGGIPPFAETQNYVRKVTNLYQPKDSSAAASGASNAPPPRPIIRYVDEYGVVHYSNVD